MSLPAGRGTAAPAALPSLGGTATSQPDQTASMTDGLGGGQSMSSLLRPWGRRLFRPAWRPNPAMAPSAPRPPAAVPATAAGVQQAAGKIALDGRERKPDNGATRLDTSMFPGAVPGAMSFPPSSSLRGGFLPRLSKGAQDFLRGGEFFSCRTARQFSPLWRSEKRAVEVPERVAAQFPLVYPMLGAGLGGYFSPEGHRLYGMGLGSLIGTGAGLGSSVGGSAGRLANDFLLPKGEGGNGAGRSTSESVGSLLGALLGSMGTRYVIGDPRWREEDEKREHTLLGQVRELRRQMQQQRGAAPAPLPAEARGEPAPAHRKRSGDKRASVPHAMGKGLRQLFSGGFWTQPRSLKAWWGNRSPSSKVLLPALGVGGGIVGGLHAWDAGKRYVQNWPTVTPVREKKQLLATWIANNPALAKQKGLLSEEEVAALDAETAAKAKAQAEVGEGANAEHSSLLDLELPSLPQALLATLAAGGGGALLGGLTGPVFRARPAAGAMMGGLGGLGALGGGVAGHYLRQAAGLKKDSPAAWLAPAVGATLGGLSGFSLGRSGSRREEDKEDEL